MNKKRQILWESKHYEFDPIKQKLFKYEDEPDDELDDEDYDESLTPYHKMENDKNFQGLRTPQQAYSVTQFGIWSLDDTLHPFKQFKFWMGHTNFNLGANALRILKETEGVEVLSLVSRYRFLIAVGQMFDIRGVRVDIENRLCESAYKEVVDVLLSDNRTLSEIVNEAREKYNEWAIFVYPNRNYTFITPENDSTFEESILKLKESESYSSGIYIDSRSNVNIVSDKNVSAHI